MDITAPTQPPEQRRRERGGFLLRFFGFMFAASLIVFVAVAAAAAFISVEGVEGPARLRSAGQIRAAGHDSIHANEAT